MTYNTVTNPKLQRASAKVTKQKGKNKYMIFKITNVFIGEKQATA